MATAFESPKASSESEYVAPFIMWQASPVTSENASILPSQGDAKVLGRCYGISRLILRVKKELNVVYSFSGSSISYVLTL